MDVPQSDVTEIKHRLGSIERRLNELATAQAVTNANMQNVRDNIANHVNSAVDKRIIENRKQGREVSSWVISFVTLGLFMAFGIISIAFQIWGA